MARGRTKSDSNITVAVVGAGVGGIAAAVKLKKAGISNFTVYEQSAGVGGTWFDNTYPGCEVDLHSDFYSFSFMRYPWPRTHATQADLLAYIEHVVDHFEIRDHFRLNKRVDSVEWDNESKSYHLRFADNRTASASVVVSALGLLNVPNYPNIPGLSDFAGPTCHTFRWPADLDIAGKRVAVVGTGSTSSQLVPAIAPHVEHLYLYQREPGWVLPKGEYDYDATELKRRARRSRPRWLWDRYKQYKWLTGLSGAYDVDSELHKELTVKSLAYIDETIEAPELRDMVRPQYPFGCKRLLLATTYYPALNRPNVTLVPRAVTAVTPTSVVSDDGEERTVDVLVLATGFHAQRYLASLKVTGLAGRDLHEVWGDRMQSLMGATVPGFPNFFMLYGPNTNGGGSIIYNLERQAEFMVRAVRRLRDGKYRAIDTRSWVVEGQTAWVDEQMQRRFNAKSLWNCHGYYHSASGRNVTEWPSTHRYFSNMLRLYSWIGLREVDDRIARRDEERAARSAAPVAMGADSSSHADGYANSV